VSERSDNDGRSVATTEGDRAGSRAGELDYRTDSGLDPETEELAANLALVLDEAFNIALLKYENYGNRNILASPGGPLNGLRVRLHDKQARWNHMLDSDKIDRVGESLRDTFLDAINYCAFAVLVLERRFPGQEHSHE
jgi:hypothetical protein